MDAELLTNVHGLATRLRLPVLWLKGEAASGRIPSLRVGRRLLFNVDAVREALAERAANREHTKGVANA